MSYNISSTTLATLLIVCLAIGVGVGYLLAPERVVEVSETSSGAPIIKQPVHNDGLLVVAGVIVIVLVGLNSYIKKTGDRDVTYIPDWVEKNSGKVLLVIGLLVVGWAAWNVTTIKIPAGHRGVMLTWGKAEDRSLHEGLNFRIPFVQKIELMTVQVLKAESTETAASHDLQDVKTTIAVNFKLVPDRVHIVYRELSHDYISRVIKPNIEESLKASTAEFTAEELITKRPIVKAAFDDILEKRLGAFNIEVVAVSLTDFQFSQTFSDAVEAKVTAEQQALEAKNKLEQVRYESQQQVIQAEAERNATVARALGEAEAVRIKADADAYEKLVDANATSKSIQLITDQMTAEYAQYLQLTQWNGEWPMTMLGTIEDLGIIINTPDGGG